MGETLEQVERTTVESEDGRPQPMGQAGAVLFAELVWTHYWWQQDRHWHREATDPEIEERYRSKLEEFERAEGKIVQVYWSTHAPSAVAMTEIANDPPRQRRLRIFEDDKEVRLHRVSDWVTKSSPRIADMLHLCDLLAIRVGEVLRGTSERIAMRWILAVQAHLLGFIERNDGRVADEKLQALEKQVVTSQTRELEKIEEYYIRAATKAGRIVYVSGMLLGTGLAAFAAGLLAPIPILLGVLDASEVQVLVIPFVCYAAGAMGALVSALSRMGSGPGKFSVDFEVGRPLLRRLGVYRPFVGAVFGLAAYFLIASGILVTERPNEDEAIFFYGIIAFFAGFSERFTNVIFGSAQRMIAPKEASGPEPASP